MNHGYTEPAKLPLVPFEQKQIFNVQNLSDEEAGSPAGEMLRGISMCTMEPSSLIIVHTSYLLVVSRVWIMLVTLDLALFKRNKNYARPFIEVHFVLPLPYVL